jgi:hypothetical protein
LARRRRPSKADLDKFARKNRLKRAGKRRRVSLETPIGRKITTDKLLQAFLDVLECKNPSARAIKPPHDLGQEFFTHLTREEQALCIIAPLVDLAHREWEDEDGLTHMAEAALRADAGQHLHDLLMLKKRLKIEAEAIHRLEEQDTARLERLTGEIRRKERQAGKRKVRAKKEKLTRNRRAAITYLQPDWDHELIAKAGDWLLDVAKAARINRRSVFDYDPEDGFMRIAPWLKSEFSRLRDEIKRRDQSCEPHTKTPPEWTQFRMDYGDRSSADFVRGAHPEIKDELTEAFELNRIFVATKSPPIEGVNNRCLDDDTHPPGSPTILRSLADLEPRLGEDLGRDFEHGRGVSALQRVPLLADQQMVDLVERFGMKVLNHKRDKLGHDGKPRYDEKLRKTVRERDEDIIDVDVTTARRRGDEPFYLTYRCDFRGRLNPIQHLNYIREDRVRALFRFARGQRLGKNDLQWLEIHCANCYGITGSWQDRFKWVAEKRGLIHAIAAEPAKTVEDWYKLDDPFRFVAACRELVAAREDPLNFVTHLPLAFDGSCNAFQHYFLIGRIREGAELVNLIDADKPHDIYMDVIRKAVSLIASDKPEIKPGEVDWADWWMNCLPKDEAELRKILKAPVMTAGYGVTGYGVFNQLRDKLGDGLPKYAMAGGIYMARKLEEAADEIMPRVKEIKDYIRGLAKVCAVPERNEPLRWTSPTGFPVINRYHDRKSRRVYYGADKDFRIFDGWGDDILRDEATNGSAPNFVHSLDAAHLIRSVNAAAEEGIDVLTIHDSFSVLAPHAKRLNVILRDQLGWMYKTYDALGRLHADNIGDPDVLPPPKYGTLDPLEAQKAEYLFS